MTPDGSVSRCLELLRAGDPEAARELWDRYFRRLVGLSRTCLRTAPRLASEAEDVALSAFDSFCRAAEGGRFPDLADREGLWRLLMTITTRKASRLIRDEGRGKRGGGVTPSGDEHLAQTLSREPDPAFAAEVAEQFRFLLDQLGEDELKSIAVWRMEGYTVEEIADRVGYVPRSVKRKLHLIRTIWDDESTHE